MNRSFWEIEAFEGYSDVIVIGAGLTGLSAAWNLSLFNPDLKITILERAFLPLGASTRNAGFACFGTITEHLADLNHVPEEQLIKRIKHRIEGLQLLRQTVGDQKIGYEACAGYELFWDQSDFERAADHVDRFNELMETQVNGAKEVYSVTECNGVPAIKNRLEGALHPGLMMRELITHVLNAGIDIRWGHEVHSVESEEGSISVHLKNHVMRADKVLLATNGFSSLIETDPRSDITPCRGYVMVTEPIEALPWRSTFHHNSGYVYFRNVGDRLLLGGARDVDMDGEATSDFGINPKVKEWLTNFADERLKLKSGWKIAHEWSGIMGFTSDKEPQVKELRDGLYLAAGLSGMGVAMGSKLGASAAEMMLAG